MIMKEDYENRKVYHRSLYTYPVSEFVREHCWSGMVENSYAPVLASKAVQDHTKRKNLKKGRTVDLKGNK